MGFIRSCLALAAGFSSYAIAQFDTSTFTPARPPSIPLAVRSPYLSTWLAAGSDSGDGGYLAGEWPTFWTGQVTAWTGLIRVDGVNYIWMGEPTVVASLVNQTAFSYTSTRSTFTFSINDIVGMTVEFLSPVLPNDSKRQSLPFSYMNVEVFSMDGAPHSVQLYTDVSGEWLSGDRSDVIQWDYSTVAGTTSNSKRSAPAEVVVDKRDHAGHIQDELELHARGDNSEHLGIWGQPPPPVKTWATKTAFQTTINPRPTITYTPYHWSPRPWPTWQTSRRPGRPTHTSPSSTTTAVPTATPVGLAVQHVYLQTQQLFSEASDQALWGDFYWTTANVANLTYQQGQDVVVRGQFVDNGYLADTSETNYRAINDDYPVFAYSVDLGDVTTTAKSTLFTVGLLQKEVIQFEGGPNTTSILPGYWTNYFSTNADAISFFYEDFTTAGGLCTAIDNQIQSDSVAAGGQDYATITSLSVRQAYGALQIAGTPDAQYVFLKEISSDGNIQTVDVIFPTHPILLYLSPQWLGQLLEPLFINQEAGNWPYAYSIHDLGTHYPNATGHNDGQDEMQPLEECGDMIIMTLAYAQRTGDNQFLTNHYDLLRQWNEYLIEEALIPANQISTDDFAGALANQTNLAIKGIVGIAAMAEIANRTGNTVDGQNYTQIALSYVQQWQTLALVPATSTVPEHTSLNYGNTSSYSLLYNIFPDLELNLGLVPQSIYDIQSAFYPTVMLTFGVPLDTRHTYTKVDWEMFCAAVAGSGTQQLFIERIAEFIDETRTGVPFTDLYDAVTGQQPPGIDFEARPVVGGEFALLALKSAPGTPALR